MQWEDEGVLIAAKKYGDSGLILSLFTKNNGKRRGFIRTSKSSSYKFGVGNLFAVQWRARSLDNLGYFQCELMKSNMYYLITDKVKAIAVSSASSILEKVLPEGEKQAALYDDLILLIDAMENDDWQKYYLKFELELLSQLGFALDLTRCTVSKTNKDLKFISPKTGKAVSEKIGKNYAHNLLPLPKMLYDVYHNCQINYKLEEFQLSLKVLGYFLSKHLFSQFATELPFYRKLLVSFYPS
ncbi:DNA repair protein RecO [Candidatus Mesenet endosymbiont of Phosphuga atrata]|uniref:DNA repair protein RecO n=1 Tax=Candidatus Mesenet endosymbiont of Phosphuga atrata TaxID=3066221 RepID=UPI0030D23B8E